MRESRTYGVVRGARGNPRPYRNPYPTASSTMEDFIRAYMWLSIAAAKGDANAVQLRDAVSKYMIDQQIIEAQAIARKCEVSGFKQCE